MKTTISNAFLMTILLVLTAQWAQAQQPMGPQFTYQGQLQDGGSPANGMYDLTFRLFDNDTGAGEVAPEQEFLGFLVVDGQLTVELDFGFDAFDGDARWLQIEVDGVPLSPRQSITAAPYSTFSNTTRGVNVDVDGNIGIGTAQPERVLHTVGDSVLVERDANDAAVVMRNTSNGSIDGQIGVRSTGLNEGYLFLSDQNLQRTLFVNDGNVGIGTSTPERVLHTSGDAILVERAVSDSGMLMRHTGNGMIQGFVGIRSTGQDEGLVILTDEDQDIVMSLNDGQVGIGNMQPDAPLHVQEGSSGNNAVGGNASAVFERSTTNYISILSPSNSQRGIQFGDQVSQGTGAIIFNNASTPDGFQFRTGGNFNRMTIDEDGYVGLGRENPITTQTWLDVQTPAGNNQFGGMYVATDGEEGIPFYGYAAGGTWDCYHYYNGGVNSWGLRFGNLPDKLTVRGDTGRIGISQPNPQFLLDVNGSAHVATNLTVGINACKPNGGSWSVCSDERYKKNISDMEGTLEKLLMLRGVTFEYKEPNSINELPGVHDGMIAQEVEKIFPDWVTEREDGYKMLAPHGFEALTVEALRDLRDEKDQQLAELRKEMDERVIELQDENDELKDRLAALEAAVASLTANQE